MIFFAQLKWSGHIYTYGDEWVNTSTANRVDTIFIRRNVSNIPHNKCTECQWDKQCNRASLCHHHTDAHALQRISSLLADEARKTWPHMCRRYQKEANSADFQPTTLLRLKSSSGKKQSPLVVHSYSRRQYKVSVTYRLPTVPYF